ncbi:MAG: DNA repair protein RadC [Candidatus Pacebacteria bacterium]|nr:DNA repair protein RadC [Candidatus Paceibacterota bacterium]
MSYYTLKSNNIIITDNKKYVLTIKDLPEKDKPREKLLEYGPTDLSVSELIAIILQTGTKKEDVLAMSSRLLKEYGEKTLANQKDPQVISKELDIPENKACQLVACFELGRRIFKKTEGGAVTIRDAKQAFNYLKDMRSLPKEQFRGLYLNSRYRLIHDEVISIGSLTASIIHPREVFKPAIEYSTAAIIVAHNHPSGSLKPTEADIEVTQKLKQASEILGIDLLDHIIIGKNNFFSIPLL